MISKNHQLTKKCKYRFKYYYIHYSYSIIIYIIFNSQIISFSKNTNVPFLLRTLFIAFSMESGAGLGITIIALYRKERFIKFGLTKTNLLKTILLSISTLILYIIFGLSTVRFQVTCHNK